MTQTPSPSPSGSVHIHPLLAGLTPELVQWVVEQRSAGLGDRALWKAMREVGWSDELASKALDFVHGAAHATLTPSDDASPSEPPTSVALPEPDLHLEPTSIDVGDRHVQVLMSLQHPRVVLFGDLLSAQECDALIDSAGPRMLRSLTVATQTGGEEINADRTSDGMFFQRGETDIVRRIEARIARLLNWPVENGEGLQVLRYGPGAQYKPHHDYFDPHEPGTSTLIARGGQRLATLVMYLNEPVQGGATTFPEVPLHIIPRKGHAVFFSYDAPLARTRTLHGGAPVIQGEKWIATKWLRERTFQ